MERKIEIRKGEIISRDELFRRKKLYHKKLSQLSFEDKIIILMRLWKIAESIKKQTSHER